MAYCIPWLDNALDTITAPAVVVAGIVLTAASITDLSPLLTWTLAFIAGGGTTATIQIGTVMIRGLSSVTTLGLGNFTVATTELIGSVVTSVFFCCVAFASTDPGALASDLGPPPFTHP